MYLLLQAATKGRVETPWQVRRCNKENASVIVSRTIHLNQKLCLDTIVVLGGTFSATATQRLDFVKKDDGRLLATSILKCKSY